MKVLSALCLLLAHASARPEVGVDRRFEPSEVHAQHLSHEVDSASLPSVPFVNGAVKVLMYFPEYNAILVPAESVSPEYSTKRRRPVSGLVKLIKARVSKDSVNVTVPGEFSSEESDEGKGQGKKQVAQAHTFGPVGQFLQRPNRPFFTPRPPGSDQFNRPSFIPAGISNFFQNREPIIKLPFPGLFGQEYSETPREPFVHYYTKTPTSEAFYYNSYHPRSAASYSDAFQTEISDYVNRVQESIMSEPQSQEGSTVMVASVPMGHQGTSLVLRPVAKAVAGAKGVAVASPIAKAVLRKGEQVDIDFDPDAVAIAGPGGQAHAHPKLIISYSNDTKPEHPSSSSQEKE